MKAFAVGCLQRGLSAKTVQNIIRTLSSLFSHAIEDNLITANPALRPGKFLPKISKRRSINPLTREEIALFLAHTKTAAPTLYRHFSVHPVLDCAKVSSWPFSGMMSISRGAFWRSVVTSHMAR